MVLVDHDRVAYLKAFGVDSIFGRHPFSVDSVCPVGSLAQSFTALAVMQLAQRARWTSTLRPSNISPGSGPAIASAATGFRCGCC